MFGVGSLDPVGHRPPSIGRQGRPPKSHPDLPRYNYSHARQELID